ncbi:MAG: hypothetical protein H7263_02960, partial [Candidatus Sericytochromatia bacterium]|nr:hypothetical protein [Candidatus Sericytochromatia bacterium]
MFLNISQQDNQIVSNLIEDGAFTNEQLDDLSKNYQNKSEKLKDTLFQKIYSLDIANSRIAVLNNKLEEVSIINLPIKGSKFKPEEWSTWANSTINFNQDNKRVGDFYSKIEDKLFIAFHNNQPCLYNLKTTEEKYLTNINKFIFPLIPKTKTESLPFDLYFFPESNYFCVTDRGSGQLHLFDSKNEKLIKTYQIRNSGSNKTINISFSKTINKLFITDNISTNLTIIDLKNLELSLINPNLGILGNLIVYNETIYLITIKPKQSLKLININDYSVKKDFPLKGELFSTGDTPCDLLQISIDQKYIYLMTHIS